MNAETLGAHENIHEFGWENKHAGLNVLVSKVSLPFIHNKFLSGNASEFMVIHLALPIKY